MPEEEIIEKILRDYPAGTKFRSAFDSYYTRISNLKNKSGIKVDSNLNTNIVCDDGYYLYVYHNGKFGEIIQDEPNIYII